MESVPPVASVGPSEGVPQRSRGRRAGRPQFCIANPRGRSYQRLSREPTRHTCCRCRARCCTAPIPARHQSARSQHGDYRTRHSPGQRRTKSRSSEGRYESAFARAMSRRPAHVRLHSGTLAQRTITAPQLPSFAECAEGRFRTSSALRQRFVVRIKLDSTAFARARFAAGATFAQFPRPTASHRPVRD